MPIIKQDSIFIPASVLGEFASLYDRLCSERLTKKEKAKLITMLSGFVRSYCFLTKRDDPVGKLSLIRKDLSLEDDDVQYQFIFFEKQSD